MNRHHVYYNISEQDWISRSLTELERDPIGFWQMVHTGKHGFGMSGPELDAFVRTWILELLNAGAVPVRGNRGGAASWVVTLDYGVDPDEVVDAILREWHGSGADPGFSDVWFAGKSFLETEKEQRKQ